MGEEFEAINCQLIGCSVDSQFTHREYTMKPRETGGLGPMKLPMVSDITKKIARDYGCLFEHSEDEGVAMRATFIIDRAGILRQISMNDLPVGRNVNEFLRMVKHSSTPMNTVRFALQSGSLASPQWSPTTQ